MSPRSRDAGAGRGKADAAVAPLLDAAFGLFVWMAHLLTVYIAAALACGLGLVARSGGRTAAGLATVLVAVTVAATVMVAVHAGARWRQQRASPDRRFRLSLTLGADAIAFVAIVWQLLAIALVPVCA
jgi:hypothetical protein